MSRDVVILSKEKEMTERIVEEGTKRKSGSDNSKEVVDGLLQELEALPIRAIAG